MTYTLSGSAGFLHYARPSWYSTNSTGKWILKTDPHRAVEYWDRLHKLSRADQFPCVMMGNYEIVRRHGGQNLICIWSDQSTREEVARVLKRIRDLGISEDMFYKTDSATAEGIRAGIGLEEYIHAYPLDTHSIYPYIQGTGQSRPLETGHGKSLCL